MKERRQFVRFPQKGLIKFREMNLPKKLVRGDETIYKNLSAGGILFESPSPVTSGTLLKLEIELRDWSRHIAGDNAHQFENLPLKLLGEVVYCDEEVPGTTYNVGVKFVGLDPKYQKAILQYLRESFDKS